MNINKQVRATLIKVIDLALKSPMYSSVDIPFLCNVVQVLVTRKEVTEAEYLVFREFWSLLGCGNICLIVYLRELYLSIEVMGSRCTPSRRRELEMKCTLAFWQAVLLALQQGQGINKARKSGQTAALAATK